MAHILPPFRADHVGSFLRTEKIANARNLFNKKLISKEELTKIEDEEIALLVEAEKKNGLKAVTDGEFRRAYWHLDTKDLHIQFRILKLLFFPLALVVISAPVILLQTNPYCFL